METNERQKDTIDGLYDNMETNEEQKDTIDGLYDNIGLYRENAIAVRVIDRSAYDATSRVHAPYLRNGCCIYYLRPTGSAHL